jgi:hypothetical protein
MEPLTIGEPNSYRDKLLPPPNAHILRPPFKLLKIGNTLIAIRSLGPILNGKNNELTL